MYLIIIYHDDLMMQCLYDTMNNVNEMDDAMLYFYSHNI